MRPSATFGTPRSWPAWTGVNMGPEQSGFDLAWAAMESVPEFVRVIVTGTGHELPHVVQASRDRFVASRLLHGGLVKPCRSGEVIAQALRCAQGARARGGGASSGTPLLAVGKNAAIKICGLRSSAPGEPTLPIRLLSAC
jgi:hypothetical protein